MVSDHICDSIAFSVACYYPYQENYLQQRTLVFCSMTGLRRCSSQNGFHSSGDQTRSNDWLGSAIEIFAHVKNMCKKPSFFPKPGFSKSFCTFF